MPHTHTITLAAPASNGIFIHLINTECCACIWSRSLYFARARVCEWEHVHFGCTTIATNKINVRRVFHCWQRTASINFSSCSMARTRTTANILNGLSECRAFGKWLHAVDPNANREIFVEWPLLDAEKAAGEQFSSLTNNGADITTWLYRFLFGNWFYSFWTIFT